MHKPVFLAVALLLASPLALACDYPNRVDIPNGNTATQDDMLASQKAVKSYMAEMEAYLECIEAEETEVRVGLGEMSDEDVSNRENAFNKKYNAAVAEMETVAARFNEEVRAYKAKSD